MLFDEDIHYTLCPKTNFSQLWGDLATSWVDEF